MGRIAYMTDELQELADFLETQINKLKQLKRKQ